MHVALQKPRSVEQFLNWAASREARYEFDGFKPVAMTGGSANHSRITTNIHAALRARLRGTPCSFFGPDLGVQTIGAAVRYPDALITRTKFAGTDRLAPDVQIIFEVVSTTSARTDRIEKVREYAAVASMRRYITVETNFAGLLVLHRQKADDPWMASTLTGDDTLELPEVGLTIAIAEFYEDVDFTSAATS